MRAVMVSDRAPARLRVGEVQEPETAPSEALVRVSAVSLNRGEVRRSQAADPGFRPGWDLAGTVERAAPDGTGPREGARVVGLLGAGAWAERVAVPVDALAELPGGVSFERAATLPVAGLTALYALEKGDGLLGRNVLVTGASGGVMAMISPRGTCVAFGPTAGAETTFDVSRFYLSGGASLYGFILFHEVLAKPASDGLGRLASLVADGRLEPRISVEEPWTEVGAVAQRLLERGYAGKAVLRVER